jgi:hypothetical protein
VLESSGGGVSSGASEAPATADPAPGSVEAAPGAVDASAGAASLAPADGPAAALAAADEGADVVPGGFVAPWAGVAVGCVTGDGVTCGVGVAVAPAEGFGVTCGVGLGVGGGGGVAGALKVAVMPLFMFMTHVHGLPPFVPEHSGSEKPANVSPAAAVAVSWTDVPSAKSAEHFPGQLIPRGELVTVPDPVPASLTSIVSGLRRSISVPESVAEKAQVKLRLYEPPDVMQMAVS